MNFFRLVKWISRGSFLSGLLGFLLLSGYASQCILVNQHSVEHFGQKYFTAQSSRSTIRSQNCPICALAQTVPRTTKITTAVQVVLTVTVAPPVSPVFESENAILLPFGARAPPLFA